MSVVREIIPSLKTGSNFVLNLKDLFEILTNCDSDSQCKSVSNRYSLFEVDCKCLLFQRLTLTRSTNNPNQTSHSCNDFTLLTHGLLNIVITFRAISRFNICLFLLMSRKCFYSCAKNASKDLC